MLTQEESYRTKDNFLAVKKRPSVSVIIPTRKKSNNLIVLQGIGRLKEHEIIICRHKGVSRARNKGANAATGEILCFLEDDILFEDKDVLNLLDLHRPRTVITCHNTFPKRPMIGRIMVISKEDFNRVGGFEESIKFGGEGADFILRCLNYGLKWIPINSPVYKHISRPFSLKIEIIRCFFETYVMLKWKQKFRHGLLKFWIGAHKFPSFQNFHKLRLLI
jgi:glycosyltransferase involved in cell wall biosynthesis